MSVRVELVCVNPDGSEQRREVLAVEARELAMETLGLTLSEGKALLAGVQNMVVAQQAYEHLDQRRVCPHCHRHYTSKNSGSTGVSTVFGRVQVPNPRWNRCPCQTDGPKTFRPMRRLNGQTSPEMLYLETKWASLIPFARVAELLKEVLPVEDSVNQESVRTHLYATAERIEQDLGEERQLNLFEGSEEDWEQQPLPDGPITVGIDGGYVRAAHKQGWFEVIAGRSVVAFRRDDETGLPSAKCFGYVQTYDEKPRRRLWELLKSQGMQEARDRHRYIEASGERQAFAVARKRGGIPRAAGRFADGAEFDSGLFGRCEEGCRRHNRVRNVHTQQPRVHSELRRTPTAG
jgi:hypothetical protein